MRKKYVYSDMRRDMTGPVVYAAIAEIGSARFVKVGYTGKLIERIAGLQTGCPVQIEDVAYARLPTTECARSAEKLIHQAMKPYRSQGEWFQFDLSRPEDSRVWRGAIPAVLNHVVGKGRWSLRSINYADIRQTMAEAKSEQYRRRIRRIRAKWDDDSQAAGKING